MADFSSTPIPVAAPVPRSPYGGRASRGRNGPFVARSLQVDVHMATDRDESSYCAISAWSGRTAEQAPAIVTLSLDDAIALAAAIERDIAHLLGTTPRREGPSPTGTGAAFYLCGGCDHWHPQYWTGDCRDDAQRFTPEQLDAKYPDTNGDGWPEWIEVDEAEEPADAPVQPA